jgi:hypothetical protein
MRIQETVHRADSYCTLTKPYLAVLLTRLTMSNGKLNRLLRSIKRIKQYRGKSGMSRRWGGINGEL